MNLDTNEVSSFLFDIIGEKGFYHALQVAKPFSFAEPELKLTAYLHDAIEDGCITEEQLTARLLHLFPEQQELVQNVIANVLILTRGSETYAEYIERVRPYENARLVKLSDMAANMQRSIELSEDSRRRRILRYVRHIPTLVSYPITEQESHILLIQNPTACAFLLQVRH